jgi:hypothetical protein
MAQAAAARAADSLLSSWEQEVTLIPQAALSSRAAAATVASTEVVMRSLGTPAMATPQTLW